VGTAVNTPKMNRLSFLNRVLQGVGLLASDALDLPSVRKTGDILMRRVFATIGTALLLSSLAIAQQTNALDGVWVGHFAAPTGALVKAEFVVSGTAGTWRSFVPQTKGRANPCVEQPHSVSIRETAEGQFALLIQASKTLRGCQDAHATVKLVEPNVLEGKFGDGRELSLKRK
jgi:hypothetical protein